VKFINIFRRIKSDKKVSIGIILVCLCFVFIYCIKTPKTLEDNTTPSLDLNPAATPMSYTSEPINSSELQKTDSSVNEIPESEDQFVSESPDKKVRVEFIVDANDTGSLNLVDTENNTVAISYEYPSDTKFYPLWKDDSSCVALGYDNESESRTFILITNKESSAFGKQIISHGISYFVDLNNQDNADGHIMPLLFIDNNTLLLSVDWLDTDGNRITKTTEWDYKHGTVTKLK